LEVKQNKLTIVAFLIIVVIAGSNFVAVKYSNEELAPFWGAFLRFIMSSAILFLYAFAKNITIPKGKELKGSLIYGFLSFGVAYALLYWSLLKVPAGIASISLAIVPLFTFILAMLHGIEKFNSRVLLGSLVAAFGIGVVYKNQLTTNIPPPALLALIAASVSIAESGVIVKLLPKIHPVSFNAVGMFIGSIVLLIFSIFAEEAKTLPFNLTAIISLAYLVFIGTITLFLLFLYVIRRWTATATSYQLVIAPLVTIALASMLRGESIAAVALIGGVFVIFGVYLGALSSMKK